MHLRCAAFVSRSDRHRLRRDEAFDEALEEFQALGVSGSLVRTLPEVARKNPTEG